MGRKYVRLAYIFACVFLIIATWRVETSRNRKAEAAQPAETSAGEPVRIPHDAPAPKEERPWDSRQLAILQKQVEEQGKLIQELEQTQNMPERITEESAGGVALVVGQYLWMDSSGKRPLRFQGRDASGDFLRDKDGRELTSFDGDGPPVVREFEGTGFLLDSGHLLTSGFVLEPWELDPIFQNSDRNEVTPSIEMIHAYFPGISKGADVKIDHASADGEVVVCTLDGPGVPPTRLKISNHDKEPLGMALTYLGYPGGVDLLAAMAPEEVKEEIYKYGTPGADEVAGILAARGYIHPISAQSRVVEHGQNHIFFETLNNIINAGGPLLNNHGEVVALSLSTHPDFTSFSRAILLAPMKPWIVNALSMLRPGLEKNVR